MGGKNSKKQLEDTIFNMRLASKQMAKESQRCQKEEKSEKLKIKKYLEKGLTDAARIHAENAIRKKNESLNYLRLSSKLDAVQSRIQSAARTEEMTTQFSRVIPQMSKVLQNMKPENISETMSNFEKVFEDLDVASGYVNESLAQTTAVSTPQDQVDQLLGEVASEHNIQVQEQMGETPISGLAQNTEEELKQRAQNLR